MFLYMSLHTHTHTHTHTHMHIVAVLSGLWNLSSPTRDFTHTLAVEAQSPNPLDHQGILKVLLLPTF